MFSLPAENWLRLAVWLALGLGIYFAYGQYHSTMYHYRAKGENRAGGPAIGPLALEVDPPDEPSAASAKSLAGLKAHFRFGRAA